MNRKAFVFAGILLAIAVAAPIIALVTTLDNDIDDITVQGPNLADETQAQNFIADIEADHTNVLITVIAVEVVCIALIGITLWIGLRP